MIPPVPAYNLITYLKIGREHNKEFMASKVNSSVVPEISGSTRIVGVFGHPVTHSLSPAMHNAALAALALPFVYVAFPVTPEELGPALRSLAALGIVGINLTIPHKEAALQWMDAITDEARLVGAVNTVHCVDGKLTGDNTDGQGFFQPLVEAGVNVAGQTVVVLGAGGAARAVCYRLAREGAQIVLANRTRERAERLAGEITSLSDVTHKPSSVRVVTWNDASEDNAELADALRAARVLVNTTRVGMFPDDHAMPPVPLNALTPTTLVYDLVYNPVETQLLLEARRRGCATLTGVKMLVYQGAAAFRLWCGVAPPTDVMEQAVLEGLRKKEKGERKK